MTKADYKRLLNRRIEMAKSKEPSILKKLANDPYTEVREAVARNPYTPKETFGYIARYECCLSVLKAAAKNPSTPEDIRGKLNEKIRRYSEAEVN